MTSAALPPLDLRPLKTPRARRALLAPELDRLLGRRHVDPVVTDQIEALQVRVRAGVDVFERRVSAARQTLASTVRRSIPVALAGVGVAVSCAPRMPLYNTPGRGFLFAVGLAISALSAYVILRALRDQATLAPLAGRYRDHVESAATSERLLLFSETVLQEAKAVGAALDLDDDERPSLTRT